MTGDDDATEILQTDDSGPTRRLDLDETTQYSALAQGTAPMTGRDRIGTWREKQQEKGDDERDATSPSQRLPSRTERDTHPT